MWSCPRCRLALRPLNGAHGRTYACGKCGGEAVPMRVATREMSEVVQRQLVQQLSAPAPRHRLHCPCCLARMGEIPLANELSIDACRRCELLWLDPGERAQLSREVELTEAQKRALVGKGLRDLASWKANQQAGTDHAPQDGLSYALAVLGFPALSGVQAVDFVPIVSWTCAALMTLGLWLWLESPVIVDVLGFSPHQPLRLSGMTVFTSTMLHAGWGHWLGNVVPWLLCAKQVEALLGGARMLALVLVASVGSCLADLLLPGHVQYVVGASGVVSALLVFFALALPHARVLLFLGLWSIGRRSAWVTVPVRWALVLWLCEQALGALFSFSGSGHVAYVAHLGGALAGALAFLWWREP